MSTATFTKSAAVPTGRTLLAGQRFTPAAAPQRRAPGAFRVRVVAETEKDEARLSFKANSRSGLGYLDEDSAGQQNIFAVEPRTYVQGSSRDTTKEAAAAQSNIITAIALVGASVVALGVAFNLQNGSDAGPAGGQEFASLSSYSQEFAGGSALSD